MELLPIQVECYAGYKAEETPRRFCCSGEWKEVLEVVGRWHQIESLPEWPQAHYFKVRSANRREYLLKHDLESNQWYLGQK